MPYKPEPYKIAIRLPQDVYNYITRIAERQNKSFNFVASSMLTEIWRDDLAAEKDAGEMIL